MLHQIDALRMDVQFILRTVIAAADKGKVYRSKRGDYLPFVMETHHLLKQLDENFSASKPSLFSPTRLGRKIVDNDHALREIAMVWMDYLTDEQLHTLQYDLLHWPFRDPVIRKFMEDLGDSPEGGPGHDDFFPQAPWYFHTVGRTHMPNGLRDREAEDQYIRGGYTGKEVSAHDLIHGDDAELAV